MSPAGSVVSARAILLELSRRRNPRQAAVLRRFFQTGPGQYGAGDVFWGLKVPQLRALLPKFPVIPLPVLAELLSSPVHEARFFALLALVRAYEKGTPAQRRQIFRFYLVHRRGINNWDLVDISAPAILGRHLPAGGGRRVLAQLAASKCLWDRRIAIVATLDHIRRGLLANTFWLAGRLRGDSEPLVQKAAGWMLREAGKRDPAALRRFLRRHAARMPRTSLRYAIEKFSAAERKFWLRKGLSLSGAIRYKARKEVIYEA